MDNNDLLSFDASYSKSRMETSCRSVEESDLDEILEIERASFEFPWSRQDFEFCLRLNRCDAFVASRDGKIVGYLVYETRRSSVRLLSCAVLESARRSGIGAFLMRELASRMDESRSEVVCMVRERNVAAQLFLRSLGFRAQWINRKFYSSAEEDAYRMTWKVDDARSMDELERQAG